MLSSSWLSNSNWHGYIYLSRNKYEKETAEKSDAELEVERFHLGGFITEFWNKLEKNSKLFDKYVKRANERVLEEKKVVMESEVIQSGSGTKVIGEILQPNRWIGGMLKRW